MLKINLKKTIKIFIPIYLCIFMLNLQARESHQINTNIIANINKFYNIGYEYSLDNTLSIGSSIYTTVNNDYLGFDKGLNGDSNKIKDIEISSYMQSIYIKKYNNSNKLGLSISGGLRFLNQTYIDRISELESNKIYKTTLFYISPLANIEYTKKINKKLTLTGLISVAISPYNYESTHTDGTRTSYNINYSLNESYGLKIDYKFNFKNKNTISNTQVKKSTPHTLADKKVKKPENKSIQTIAKQTESKQITKKKKIAKKILPQKKVENPVINLISPVNNQIASNSKVTFFGSLKKNTINELYISEKNSNIRENIKIKSNNTFTFTKSLLKKETYQSLVLTAIDKNGIEVRLPIQIYY